MASQDAANCVLLEYEASLTQRPHILAFTFKAVPASEALTQLNASPSCMRADAILPREASQASLDASAMDQLPTQGVQVWRQCSAAHDYTACLLMFQQPAACDIDAARQLTVHCDIAPHALTAPANEAWCEHCATLSSTSCILSDQICLSKAALRACLWQVPNGAAHQPREASPAGASRDPRLQHHLPTQNGHQVSASPEQTPFPSPHLPVPQPAVQGTSAAAAAAQQHRDGRGDLSGMHALSEAAALGNGLSGTGAVADLVPESAALSPQMAALGDSLVEEASCAGLYGEWASSFDRTNCCIRVCSAACVMLACYFLLTSMCLALADAAMSTVMPLRTLSKVALLFSSRWSRDRCGC